MSKTIISVSLLGAPFMDVLFREIATFATERGLNADEIQKQVMSSNDINAINKIFNENFDGELKIME
jgi:acyl-[acyl carrier protein]--UDP-N-acetylglucosamine O-acyltransferase